MLNKFNNYWVLLFCFILFLYIIKQLCNLNKPFDEERFIKQYINQRKIKKQINTELLHKSLPLLTSYYVGI
jgi:hypothetical protein